LIGELASSSILLLVFISIRGFLDPCLGGLEEENTMFDKTIIENMMFSESTRAATQRREGGYCYE